MSLRIRHQNGGYMRVKKIKNASLTSFLHLLLSSQMMQKTFTPRANKTQRILWYPYPLPLSGRLNIAQVNKAEWPRSVRALISEADILLLVSYPLQK